MKPSLQSYAGLDAPSWMSPSALTAGAGGRLVPTRHNGAPPPLPQLKVRLLRGLLAAAMPQAIVQRLRQAANAAEAVAWETPYPLLVFPCLFDEMVREIL
jgi:hypothetical protein